MRKIVALLLLSLFSVSLLFSADISLEYEYQPYEDDEFSSFAMELRRAETIFFGSFALTLPLSIGVYSLLTSFGVPKSGKESTDFLYQLAGAAGASLIITGIDWILGRISND